jgi:subtilisin-like proprotein convertase family protein
LAVLVENGEPREVWEVRVPSAEPLGDFIVLVDAATGRLLRKRDVLWRLDGTGRVFDPNPVVTLRSPYLKDRADAADAVPEKAYRTVALRDIHPSGILRGPYVNVSDSSHQAREPGLQFFYNRSDERFEQVMVYFHIDRNRRYLESLGYTSILNFPLTVIAHASALDESYYSSFSKTLTYGSGGVDDAEDADIIIHEYGHAIQDDQVPGYGASDEAMTMGEGFGDYWAFSNDSDGTFNREIIGDWDAVSYSTADPPYLRRVDENLRYPGDLVHEEHEDGRIWSRALYDIWNALGKTTTDTLVIESHFALSPDATLFDGALAIYETDRRLYGGVHLSRIFEAFDARGLAAATLSKSHLTVVAGEAVHVPVRQAVLGGPATFRWEQVAGPPAEDRIITGDTLSFVAPDPPDDALMTDLGFRLYAEQDGRVVSHNDLTVTVLSRGILFDDPGALVRIPDNSAQGITRAIRISKTGPVSEMLVYFQAEHTYRGDLEVKLTSPSGVTSTLLPASDTPGSGLEVLFHIDQASDEGEELKPFLGQEAQGLWTLTVTDTALADTGSLCRWALGIETETEQTHVTAIRHLPEQYHAGDVIDVTIELRRSGPTGTATVELTETVPTGWAVLWASPLPATDRPLVWQMGLPSDGSSLLVQYRLQAPVSVSGTQFFDGVVRCTSMGTVVEHNIEGDISIQQVPTITVTTVTRDLPDRFSPGQKIQVSLSIWVPVGTGPTAATIVEQIPASWDFVSGTLSPSYDAGAHTLTWNLDLPPGPWTETIPYSLHVPVDENTSRTFSGTFTYEVGNAIHSEPVQGDLRVDPPPGILTQIYVTRTLPKSVDPGRPFEVVLETVAFGPRPLVAWIEETIPAHWQLISTDPGETTFHQSGTPITWIFAEKTGVTIPTIHYALMAPTDQLGPAVFSGTVNYLSNGDLLSGSVIGDTTASVGTSPGKPVPIPVDLRDRSPLYREEFESTDLAQTGFMVYPGGLDGLYGPGGAQLGTPSWGDLGSRYGQSLLTSAAPGEVITVVLDPTRAIAVEAEALLSVRVTSSGPGATIAIALVEQSFDGSLGFLSPIDSGVFENCWGTLNTYFSPASGGVLPVLQIANIRGTEEVSVAFDNLTVYPVRVTTDE